MKKKNCDTCVAKVDREEFGRKGGVPWSISYNLQNNCILKRNFFFDIYLFASLQRVDRDYATRALRKTERMHNVLNIVSIERCWSSLSEIRRAELSVTGIFCVLLLLITGPRSFLMIVHPASGREYARDAQSRLFRALNIINATLITRWLTRYFAIDREPKTWSTMTRKRRLKLRSIKHRDLFTRKLHLYEKL